MRALPPGLCGGHRWIAALALGGVTGLAAAGDFHAPATVSAAAQESIRQFSREARNATLPAPDDVAGWKKVQAAVETKRAAANAAVVQAYEPVIAARMLGQAPVLDIRPRGWKESRRVLVYTHGGAYTMYSARSRLTSAVPMADATGLRVISIDYTLAPHARWRETVDQVVAVVQALRAEGHAWSDIAIYGESAGGGLAAGAVLRMRDQGLGQPVAVVLWSPWSDLTDTGDSYATLADADPVLYYPGNLKNCADAYADHADQRNPYVSPVYADYTKGFPATLIQVGTKEIFLSNAVRQYQAMDQAGVAVKLDPYEGMWHIFQVFSHDIPEARLARAKVRRFLEAQFAR